jgi:hypothetical protein
MSETRSALIVASDTYSDPSMQQLRAPATDAQALAAVLRNPDIGNFDVNILHNRPAHEVNFAVEEFFAERRPTDLLLLHFSCHGVKDESGELYFAMENTLLRRLGATGVSAEFVSRRMTRSRSRRQVLLLDCCYAGAFERGMTARAGSGVGIEAQFGGRGRAVITASSAMEYAFEGDQLTDASEARPSVFTSALVAGLETGDADRDQDGLIGLDELYDYVYDKVRTATPNQTPGKWTFGVEGELVIAHRSSPITSPAPLPAELHEAIDSPFVTVRVAAVHELARLIHGRHVGLALGARQALERLIDDDSRRVAAEAATALDEGNVTNAVEPDESDAGDGIEPVTPPQPLTSTPSEPVAAPGTIVKPAVEPDESDLAPAPERSKPATRAAEVNAPISATTDDPARASRANVRLLLAGVLTIGGAALTVGSIFPYFAAYNAISDSSTDTTNSLLAAALAFVAGACLLVPRTRTLVGPGLALAIAAVAPVGLLYDMTVGRAYPPVGPGLWLDVASNVALILAGCLIILTLRQTRSVRLAWPPSGPVPWLIAILGAVAAAALFVQVVNDTTLPGRGQAYRADQDLAPLIAAAAITLLVPAIAAIAHPRLFGVALLAGSIAAGASGVVYYTGFASLFALSLLGLLTLVAPLARSDPHFDEKDTP